MAKVQFASKIGLIAATVGSAVGLGNVWRFPAEAQANGGGAFLLLYIICVLVLGVPVMLAEFSLGRQARSDVFGVFQKLSPHRPWWIVGAFAIAASYMILSFYMVVAGWTLEYFIQSITGDLYREASAQLTVGALDNAFQAKLQEYVHTDWRPLFMTFGVLVANMCILLMGVQKGIEKMSNIMMPLLFVILLIFAVMCATLPAAGQGYAFFLTPDFSKINADVVVNALGQTFFSLSLGMGILITYAGYYPKDTKLTQTSVTVSMLSVLVAVMMGLIIFPAVMSYGLADHELEGATLVFQTLPEVFVQMPGAQWWSALFFLLLLVAALTSTISLAEVAIALLQDRAHMRRVTATMVVIAPLFVFSSLCSLSMGSLRHFTICGLNIFDLLDTVATNYMLPLVAIATCIYVGWFAPKGLLRDQLTNDGTIRARLYGVVWFILRYLSPLMIAAVFAWRFF